MRKSLYSILTLCRVGALCLPIAFATVVAAADAPSHYQGATGSWFGQKALEKSLRDLARNNGVDLDRVGKSPDGQDLLLLTIEARDAEPARTGPAVLVVGDPLGTTPLAIAASVKLAEVILAAPDTAAAARVRWYILPSLNPDGAARFHEVPLQATGRNLTPLDDDRDGQFGEDPPDDLDGDGLITTLLLADPAGTWVLDDGEFPLPRPADAAAGEVGRYLRLVEGKDDDGDGLWNEDAPGGVVPGRNFPHSYRHWTDDAGRWAADQPESRALLEFAFSHPDIAMLVVLGRSNTLAEIPGLEKARSRSRDSVRFLGYRAERANVEPGTEMPLGEALILMRDVVGRPNLTEDDVLDMLTEDPEIVPAYEDLAWWEALAARRGELQAAAAGEVKRRAAPAPVSGSLEGWGYFQYGVPSIALDFWTVPEIPVETDAAADSAAIDDARGVVAQPETSADAEEEPEVFDPASSALAAFTAIAAADPRYEHWPGYRPWREVELPDGRQGLVGGVAPFAATTPPVALRDSLIATILPLVLELPDWLPGLELAEVQLEHRGADVYELKVWLGNPGRIAYPTAHGKRTRRPPPVVASINGAEIIEGRPRTPLPGLPAGGAAVARWLVRAEAGTTITITAEAPSLGRITAAVTAGGQGGQR